MITLIEEHLQQMSDTEIQSMLRAEYLRKLTRYKKVDEKYRKKYGMTFEQFDSRNIVADRDYSWEVESDSQQWEAAIDGIETMLSKLKEIGIEAF
jgi:hypothetical protein